MYYDQSVKIVPHGHLKNLIPDGVILSGTSVEEVINGLSKQHKSLHPQLGEEKHCIQVYGVNEDGQEIEFMSEEAIRGQMPNGVKELHVCPEMVGGKSGGFFRIVVGAVLIAAAFYLGGPTLAGPVLFGETTIAGLLFNFGLSLVLGGLLQLLSPAPEIDQFGVSEADPEASKYLGATQNTVKIGTRIPLLYGKHIAYGHYISFDVDAKDVAV